MQKFGSWFLITQGPGRTYCAKNAEEILKVYLMLVCAKEKSFHILNFVKTKNKHHIKKSIGMILYQLQMLVITFVREYLWKFYK